MYYFLLAFFLGQGNPNVPVNLNQQIKNYPTTYSVDDPTNPNDPTTDDPGDHTVGGDQGTVRPPRPKK